MPSKQPIMILALALTLLFSFSLSPIVSAQDAVEHTADAEAIADTAEEQTEDSADELADELADVFKPTPVVGWLDLSESLRDGPVPYAWITDEEAGPSLSDVLGQLDHVAQNDEYLGVVIYMDQPMLSLTQVLAISDKIQAARDAGKLVMTYAEAYNMMDYVLASSADLVLLQHKGEVRMTGIAVEEMYLAGTLEKIGAKADLVQIGKYKGASESMMRTGPSEAWSQNFDALLDDIYSQIITRIADNRSITKAQVEKLLADSWTMTDTDLLRRRVVDRLTDRDLIDVTEVEFGDSFIWDTNMGFGGGEVQINNPMMLFSLLFKESNTRTSRPTIAVVHGKGPIHSGESSHGGGMFASESIGSSTMVEALGHARDDENIKGVVLRIDSPGGSALASEIIWQAVRDLGETKPVYVSVGGMAASGGYYIACAGDEVYLGPSSIVGSIGVVGGKIVIGGLYDWAGISIHRRSRGPLSDIFNSVEPFTDEQRTTIRQSMQNVYDQFINRVTIGRGSRLADANAVAEGRLFTGRQAVENGMADKLGGAELAMTDLAEELGLEEGAYDVINLPPAMSLHTFLNDMFGAQAPAVQSAEMPDVLITAKRILGPRAWSAVSAAMQGLLLLQDEPVLTLMPNAIVIR